MNESTKLLWQTGMPLRLNQALTAGSAKIKNHLHEFRTAQKFSIFSRFFKLFNK
jgi:hypothetical protein